MSWKATEEDRERQTNIFKQGHEQKQGLNHKDERKLRENKDRNRQRTKAMTEKDADTERT